MFRSVIGVLAHVDAGKTTLCEAILYSAGALRRLGRVDHRDCLLDNNGIERERGITVFSKQAQFTIEDRAFTLLDTPGHADLVCETERVLPVLDCALLVISASGGVQSHTLTLWKLLRKYNIPTIIFVTKEDMYNPGREELLKTLRKELSSSCISLASSRLDSPLPEDLCEELALLDEELMNSYLEGSAPELSDVQTMFSSCKLFPVLFGSGLKLQGIPELLKAIYHIAPSEPGGDAFGARVFKISHDDSGAKNSLVKIVSGSLKVRDTVTYQVGEETVSEKITSLKMFAGSKANVVAEALPGDVVSVTGLSSTASGTGLGVCRRSPIPMRQPVMRFRVVPADGTELKKVATALSKLEEEDPLLRVTYSEALGSLHLNIMGDIQLQVLKSEILTRFGYNVDIIEGRVLYRETISDTTEGVGHYEPLRHYAEVHLLLEPAERGSGITFASDLSTDVLSVNWQHLILHELTVKQHLGVLGGFPLTDVKLTLKAGKAHLKHTEGGDFREAANRAVRQGLMQAKSVILEPVYSYTLVLPTPLVGRALGDIKQMCGDYSVAPLNDTDTVITGHCPVSEMQGYASVVASYSSGKGQFYAEADGYSECHNPDAVRASHPYEPTADTANSPDSVFCKKGAGFIVPWNQVKNYMHLESVLKPDKPAHYPQSGRSFDLDERNIDEIMDRELGPIRRKIYSPSSTIYSSENDTVLSTRRNHLILDGYNVLFAWEDLKKISERSLDLARTSLMNIMSDYSAFTGVEVLIVFDAYRSSDENGKRFEHHGIEVIFTDKGETADAYIERIADKIGKDDLVTVVSSDNLVRMGSLRSGVRRMSSSNLQDEVTRINNRINTVVDTLNRDRGFRLGDVVNKEELEEWLSKIKTSSEEQKT